MKKEEKDDIYELIDMNNKNEDDEMNNSSKDEEEDSVN